VLVQLMVAMASIAVLCWFGATLIPLWWGVVHPPTKAEIAAALRQEAARWRRLAVTHHSLVEQYQKLADKSAAAAIRFDPKGKATSP
jgi:hypothetical protein